MKGEVPDDLGPLPLGKARVVREGSDLTIVATQLVCQHSLKVAEELAAEGISVEIIDLRTMVPLDSETLLSSIAKTGRLVVVEEAPHASGWGGDIVSLAADQGIFYLDAPVKRVNMGNVMFAYSEPLEKLAIPSPERIKAAVREVLAT